MTFDIISKSDIMSPQFTNKEKIMKITQEKNKVTVGGISNTSTFGATMNAKAFKVMSDGLYKNKIGSIVREVSCNAKDAHTQANKHDVPFTIHLPCTFEPYFSVEDEGVGLSDDQIVQVFCTLFESTKEGSNEEVGAFGLGSKTPFAYTNAFIVTSIFDGVLTNYSMYMNDDDIPCISTMGDSEKTDKPNGVKVQIPVQRNDYSEFADEVKTQLKYLKVKPVILNDVDFAWETLTEPSLTIGTVELLSGDSYLYGSSITIIQGEVGYPLEMEFIRDKLTKLNVETLDFMKNNGARVTFKIGEIGVIPSREGIEYKKHTITNIENKITTFRKGLVSEVKKKMDAINSNWLKVKELNNDKTLAKLVKMSEYTLPKNVEREHGGDYVFNLHGAFTKKVKYSTKLPDGTIKTGDMLSRQFKLVRYQYTTYGGDNVGIDTKFTPDTICPDANGEREIFIKDTGKLPMVKIRHHMKENDLTELFVLSIGGDNTDTPESAFDAKTVARFKSQLGGVKMTRIRDLHAPARDEKSTYTKNLAYLVDVNMLESGWNRMDSVYNWGRVKGYLDDLEPQVYITVDRYSPTCRLSLLNELEQLAKCGLVKYDLYAFNLVTSKRVAKIDGWVELEDYVTKLKPVLETMFQSCDEYMQLVELKNVAYADSIGDAVAEKLYKKRHLADKNSDGQWYINTSKNLYDICQKRLRKQPSNIRALADHYDTDIQRHFTRNNFIRGEFEIKGFGNYTEIAERLIKCKNKFRLLPTDKYIYSPSSGEIEHIFEYVNCMSERT